MFHPACSVLKNGINMERGDLGAGLTVLTSQIDFLIMAYSTIALGMWKWFGALGEILGMCFSTGGSLDFE
jgi:hypothetical protein